jgi:hypothetical protein
MTISSASFDDYHNELFRRQRKIFAFGLTGIDSRSNLRNAVSLFRKLR